MDCFKLGLDKTASHQTVKPPSATLTCEHRVRPIRVHTLGVTLERSKATGTLDGHDVTEKLHRSEWVRTISQNNFENGSNDIGKHRTKSENKNRKWKAEIKKSTQEKSKNVADHISIRKLDGPDQKTGR